MSCHACAAFDAAERAAIEGREMPAETIGACTCESTDEIAITYLTPARFRAKTQVGLRIVHDWLSLLRWLTRPAVAENKKEHGAWCPCDLAGGRVKGSTGAVHLICFDVDDTDSEGLDRSARALAQYAGAIIPTFSATPEQQKHRIVLRPTRTLDADEFPLVWTKMARRFASAGIAVDTTCKNINRLYFAPATPNLDRWLGARVLTGHQVPVDAILHVARTEAEEAERRRAARPRPPPVKEHNRDRYIAGAIDRARANVSGASPGNRHHTLLQEAFALARFGLDAVAITELLLSSFVAAAGESRRYEGQKAIRDAVAARKGAA